MSDEIKTPLSEGTPETPEFVQVKARITKGFKAKLDEKFNEAFENGTHEFKGNFVGDLLENGSIEVKEIPVEVIKEIEVPKEVIKEVEVVKEVKKGSNTWWIVVVVFLVITVIGLIIALVLNSSKKNKLKAKLEAYQLAENGTS